MKRYYSNDDLPKDPIRNGYNLQPKQPSTNSLRLENEIQMRNSFYKNSSSPPIQNPNDLLPLGDQNFRDPIRQSTQPVTNSSQRLDTNVTMRDITSFTNDKNKVNTMVQEIFEKDKEIQSHKNEIEVCNGKIRSLEAEKQQFKSNEMEVVVLQEKLNEQNLIHQNTKELVKEHKELYKLYEESQETIETLRKVILKQNSVINPDYQNEKLRLLLQKYHPQIPEETIKSVFETLEITEDMEISKELLEEVMNELRD
jgi:hypothetical protein